MELEEELTLIEKAKENIQAFDALFAYYHPKIYSYIATRTLTKEISEDICSEVFLASVPAIARFDTSKRIRFGSWLYKTAHNKIVDYFRKHKTVSFDLSSIEIPDSYGPEEYLSKLQRQREVITVLQTLNSKYQQLITFRYYTGLEVKEIAFTLGIKPSRVSVSLHRALKSFEKKFRKKYPESEIFL